MGRENYFVDGFMEKSAKVFLSGPEHHGRFMFPIKKWAGRGMILAGLGGAALYNVTKNPQPMKTAATAQSFGKTVSKGLNSGLEGAKKLWGATTKHVQKGLEATSKGFQAASEHASHPVMQSGFRLGGDVSKALSEHPTATAAAGAAFVGHKMLGNSQQQQRY